MSKKSQSTSKPMSQSDASRIQSATARHHGGTTPAGSFAARSQRAAARNIRNGKK